MSEVRRTEGEPHDEATRLAGQMADALPEREGLHAIALVYVGDRGGICLHGYDDDTEALVDMFLHLRSIFRAQGKELYLAGLDKPMGRG